MSEALSKIDTLEEVRREPAPVRRFEPADLSQHGPWLLKRFAVLFPEFTEQKIGGYLSNLVWDNEHSFLYQPHAVALFQVTHSPGIKTTKVVQERFVWVEDPKDKEQLEAAADFYTHIKLWATRQSAERIIVMENSDVPKALVELRLGRLFDTKISYARL